MDRPAADQPPGPDLRAIAVMYANLQRAAVRGIVPHDVFHRETGLLGLGEAERQRMVDELGRLKLRIGEPARSVESDPRRPTKVVQPTRIALARRLLERFADGDGAVATRALDGVIRLTGLAESEAAQLRALVTVTQATTPPQDRADLPIPEPRAVAPSDLAAALAAGRAVLTEDRFTRRPGKRILTATEEVGLSVLLRGGPDRLCEEPTNEELSGLDPSDERRRARDCLVTHNRGLVHGLARQYPVEGMDYDDVAQHGMLGLLRATRKFDPTMGNKFSTYATWWIKQSITRGIANEANSIRIPVHMHEQMQKVARAKRELQAQGRPTHAADLAVACDMTVEKVDQVLRLSKCSDSLDRVIVDGAHLGDLIEVRTAIPGVEHTVLSSLSTSEILAAVNGLPERYARVVTMRFGLDGNEPATLDQIGAEFGVTRERVRQLEAQVLPVLRLAFSSRADAPAVAMQQMLDDPWHSSSQGNPVSRIAKDLTHREWAAGLAALGAYQEREGHVRPALNHVEDSVPLGRWVAAQRLSGGISGLGLPAHRRFALEALGVEWRPGPAAAAHPLRRRRWLRGVPYPVTAARASTGPQAADESVTSPELVEETSVRAANAPDCVTISQMMTRYTAHWGRASGIAAEPERNPRRLADYALLALGPRVLLAVLGNRAAAAVTQAATGRRQLDRPIVLALESLAQVLDALNGAGLRPEAFFESSSAALSGSSPHGYLTKHPLVKPEAQLALSNAIRTFLRSAEQHAEHDEASLSAAPPAQPKQSELPLPDARR